MPDPAIVTADMREAEAFAESVAGVLRRHGPADGGRIPDRPEVASDATLAEALDGIGWDMISSDPGLVACAGLGAAELGRGLASIWHVDRLLGASPLAGNLVRGPVPAAMTWQAGRLVRRDVVAMTPCPAAGGLEVHRVLELGGEHELGVEASRIATAAWLAAGVGYLAGLGEAALELTVEYVGRRAAFGTTLAGLSAVQQLLASAATAVRGVRLLAADSPAADGLAHAGQAVAEACAACHQVTGAVGFTLEHPLHRFSQRARAVSVFNDALLERCRDREAPAQPQPDAPV